MEILVYRGLIIGNINNDGIENIVNGYKPYNNKVMSTSLDGGIRSYINLQNFDRKRTE